jgi:hypothetical protein
MHCMSHPTAKSPCVGNKYSIPRWDSNTHPASLLVNAKKKTFSGFRMVEARNWLMFSVLPHAFMARYLNVFVWQQWLMYKFSWVRDWNFLPTGYSSSCHNSLIRFSFLRTDFEAWECGRNGGNLWSVFL